MKDQTTDPRQSAILMSAWQAFATYGFRKTSMDDIARGAGMSRPALYLHYKNKEDIFRSLVQAYYDTATEQVAQALTGGGNVTDTLGAAFSAQLGEMVEAMLNSPHGMELLDAGATTASDIKAAGEGRLTGLYATWLQQEADQARIHLSQPAEQVASTITTALKSIKMDGSDYATICSRIGILSDLLGKGLTAP